MIITVTMNPAIDKTAYIDTMHVGGLNRLQNINITPGGKGINVSKTIANLEYESIATGFLAGSNGAYIKSHLDTVSINNDMVFVEGETRTNLKVIDVHKELTELNEVGVQISPRDLQSLNDKLISLIQAKDIVVLSGSVPQGVPKDIYAKLVEEIKQREAKVILDADGSLFEQGVVAIPNVIKPNKYELCKYFNVEEEINDLEVVKLAKRLLSQGMELIVVSMGHEGALFIDNAHCVKVAGLDINVNSTVGAGDAMVAALAYAMDKHLSFEEMVTLAVATSAGACESEGTKPASLSRVQELMWQVKIKKVEE